MLSSSTLDAFESLRALDGPEILPEARSQLLHHDAQTPLAVVLLHGFTNHPGQFREFAPLVFERGANVLIPRMPEHGDRDRLTLRLKKLTAETMMETAARALDIAAGLGERVVVLGISSSGLLAAWLAQSRTQVSRAIAIAPEFAILDFSRPLSHFMEVAIRVIPDMMVWWDPRVKNGMHPLTAYPRFPTRALGQTLRVADIVYDGLKQGTPHAELVAVVNPNDPAVNNGVTKSVVQRWKRCGAPAKFVTIDRLPRNHDIIEPDNPKARTDLVYPRLIELLYGQQ